MSELCGEDYEAYVKEFKERGLPERMARSVYAYVEGQMTSPSQLSGFLSALLSHDLWAVHAMADEENWDKLSDWIKFVHNCLPGSCHGSRKRVNQWIEKEQT